MHKSRLKRSESVKLTSHADTRLSLLPPRRKNIKHAAVAALIVGTHLLDGDGAAVFVRSGEVHARVLMADHHGAALLVRQQHLVVTVEPAYLADDVVRRCGEAAAEHQRVTYLCGESGVSRDCTCAQRSHDA